LLAITSEACEAIGSLCHVSTISTLLNTFILPLQQQVDAESRVHASLNINTETGRLSCRNPNLQNQVRPSSSGGTNGGGLGLIGMDGWMDMCRSLHWTRTFTRSERPLRASLATR